MRPLTSYYPEIVKTADEWTATIYSDDEYGEGTSKVLDTRTTSFTYPSEATGWTHLAVFSEWSNQQHYAWFDDINIWNGCSDLDAYKIVHAKIYDEDGEYYTWPDDSSVEEYKRY